jgi:hypothetical protein
MSSSTKWSLKRVALAISALYLVLALTFSLLTPAWENNDELDHVAYIEHVVADASPPRIALDNGIESHQPPLYYYLVAGWQVFLGIDRFTPDALPASPAAISAPSSFEGYALIHAYTPAQHRHAVSVHLLRLMSIAIGLVAVLAAVATGWLLTERLAFAAALGATVAFWPKFLVVMSAVTNTALVVALCALAVPCVLIWERSRSLRWAAATGLVLGAAALTQETALPVAGLMLILLLVLAGDDWRTPLVAIGCFVAVCGWWFVRNTVLYGDPLAAGETETYLSQFPGAFPLVRDPPSLSPSVLGSSLGTLSHSTWYDGGWNQLQLPHAVDWVVLGSALLCIGAALWSQLRERLLLATCALGSLIGWLLLIRSTPQAEGRYLLVAIVAWAALLVAGAVRLAPGRAAALWVWPTIMLALDGYVLAKWLVPYAQL